MSKTSWSYSDFSVATSCLQKYKLVKLDKIVPEGLDSGDMAFGTAVHAGIELLLNGNTFDDAMLTYDYFWDGINPETHNWSRFNHEALHGIGKTLLTKFNKLHAKKFVPEVMEKRFYADYAGTKFEGTPDFIGTYDGMRALFDWKTAGYNYPKDKNQVALQLYLYAYLAAQNGLPYPEVLGYLVFNKGTGSIQTIVWQFEQDKMKKMLDDMKDYCDSIDMRTTHPKNPNACYFGQNKCGYWNQCWGKK